MFIIFLSTKKEVGGKGDEIPLKGAHMNSKTRSQGVRGIPSP